jgi:hypothetical protein
LIKKPYPVLRAARWALLILAYLFGALNLIFAGFVPLLIGGEPIPILADGTTIPARFFGLLSILISAPLSFLLFYVPSGMIHLLLALAERAHSPATASRE